MVVSRIKRNIFIFLIGALLIHVGVNSFDIIFTRAIGSTVLAALGIFLICISVAPGDPKER